MKRSKTLEVVVNTQVDYALPSRPAYVPGAEEIIVPGIEFLCSRNAGNSAGVLMVTNRWEANEYGKSELASKFRPHCLIGGWGDYDPVGVQNVFSPTMIEQRGLPVWTLHKRHENMWQLGREGFLGTVHRMQGSNAEAWTLADFVDEELREAQVNTVNIWGVSSDDAVKKAISGFLAHGFSVNVINNLCRHREVPIKQVIKQSFSRELAAKTVTLMKWETRRACTAAEYNF